MKGPSEIKSEQSFRASTPPPADPCLKPENRDHLMGDGLRVKMTSNASNLWIQGDGCRVSLAINSGFLRVSGDGCRVHIAQNLGSVEYLGDGGHITLGPKSVNGCEHVKYEGDGGIIEFGNRSNGKKCDTKDEKKTKTKSKRMNGDGSVKVITSTGIGKKIQGKNVSQRSSNECGNVYIDMCIKSKC